MKTAKVVSLSFENAVILEFELPIVIVLVKGKYKKSLYPEKYNILSLYRTTDADLLIKLYSIYVEIDGIIYNTGQYVNF